MLPREIFKSIASRRKQYSQSVCYYNGEYKLSNTLVKHVLYFVKKEIEK